MISNLVFSINIVAPWIVMVAIGFMIKRLDIIDDQFATKGNRIVFLIFLPSMLFWSVYTADLRAYFDLRFILFVTLWTIITFFVIWGLSVTFIKDRTVISAFVQGSCRSNVGALAVPLAFSVLGDSAVKSVFALAVLIPIYNIMCVVLLTVYNVSSEKKFSVRDAFISISKNPSIISILLGIGISFIGLQLPDFISSTVSSMSQVTIPLVLIFLGAGISLKGNADKFKYVVSSSLIKVIVMPLCVTLVAYAFGFRGSDLAILMLINGVPTAIAGYVMVKVMGGDGAVASSNIVLTTILSAFTLAMFIFAFMSLGIIVQ